MSQSQEEGGKVVTQKMLDQYFEYQVAYTNPKKEDVLTRMIRSDIKLTDTATEKETEYDSIGTKLVIRNDLFGEEEESLISNWATSDGKELKMLEIVILSATINKYIRLKNLSEYQQETRIVTNPEQLIVVLEDKEIRNKIRINTDDETDSKVVYVLRKQDMEEILEADCYGRTISLSRSQSTSEGMMFQIQQDKMQANWEAEATSVLTRLYFEIPEATISPDILVVNLEVGIRVIRGEKESTTS